MLFWFCGDLPAGPERVAAVPSPRLAYRLGSCAPVGRVQDRRSWQRRPVRGRAPLALAHPLPCSYQAKGDSPRHGRGKILLYISFQRGSWRSLFVSPTGKKVGGGNTFLVIGDFGGYSLRRDTSLYEGGWVSPAGSGPAPRWGASRTDGRGNGDRFAAERHWRSLTPSHARTKRRTIAPRHGRGKILLYISFQRGSWRSPFETPTGRKVRGGNTFLVIGAFGGYSLRHAAGVTPPSMREAGSHLPVRVLRPGGARPGPTVVATETGSRQSATGARSPPSLRGLSTQSVDWGSF